MITCLVVEVEDCRARHRRTAKSVHFSATAPRDSPGRRCPKTSTSPLRIGLCSSPSARHTFSIPLYSATYVQSGTNVARPTSGRPIVRENRRAAV